MKKILTWMTLLVVAGSVQAQEMRVYYDYVENGELRGGKIVLDRSNPEHRRIFGLDLPADFQRTVWPVTTVVDNGTTANRIDLVMLGDGYTQNEIESYAAHVDTVITDFLSEGVIGDYASYFNVHRVDVTSNKSGVDEIDLGDTIGVAVPTDIELLYDELEGLLDPSQTTLHLHNTRGTALASVYRAMELGVFSFDASCGGLGGCPYAPGAAGNLATEDLVYMCEQMDCQTGVDLEKLFAAGRHITAALGRSLTGRVFNADGEETRTGNS
ncbi:MAG: hypothetical protein IH891_04770 [Planctomycetes bacterium]|nr:hypothetical protein [Planctomycetota bacterium]